MRAVIAASMCLGLAACSARQDSYGSGNGQTDVSEPGPPGIAVTAAPGVAFAYHYAFSLPSGKISRTQEAHAQACEKLGIARCRITGMRYRLLGENNIEAMLAFKLDPAIARTFGKDGIATVDAAQGKLVDAEVTGTDAGAELKRLDGQRARTEDAVKRIDQQLADPRLKSAEREGLQRQRADLVQNRDATKDDAALQEASLATTPVVFDYGSGPAVRGFDASAPLTSALDTAAGSAQITLAILLGFIALVGPPGLVFIAGFLLWRRFRPRGAGTAHDATTPS